TLGRIYPKADWAPRPFRAKTTLLALAENGEFAYPKAVGVTDPALRQLLYTDAARKALGGHTAEQRYTDAMKRAPARDGLDRAQYADIQHWLPGDILTKVDRTSMAVSLEAREPLLDYRLVQFAATLPPALRIKAGQGKWLMKKALEPYLPKEILYRPKMGFVTPISAWFRKALAEDAAALSRSKLLASTGWFDLSVVEKLAADHKSGRAEHGRTLWQLLMLERSLKRLFV
ncbi:MAG: asparagine synthetase B, partial [Sphingomonadales bacterium]